MGKDAQKVELEKNFVTSLCARENRTVTILQGSMYEENSTNNYSKALGTRQSK